ncbi:MAG TPA: family 10 glycosylhydrolase, partial [bacterium]|nr:family 10 glycosylhydrolase [bacterium]
MLSRRRPRLLLVLLAAAACLARPAPGRAEARGLWVECEGTNATLDTRERIDQLVERARAGNFNVLYVQVYRHDRAWFNSAIADATPYRTVFSREKMDPLSYLLQKAHAAGIQVHAWMNMFRIGKDLSAPVVRRLGREVVTRDGAGKSLADYKPELLPDGGYWLDPGDKRVCRYLLEVIAELIRKYPGVDGVHLDFIRYPYASATGGSLWAGRRDFGYGAESAARFREWTGLDPLKMELTRENCQAWDNWRRF